MLSRFVVTGRTLLNDTFFKAVVWTFHLDTPFLFLGMFGGLSRGVLAVLIDPHPVSSVPEPLWPIYSTNT